MHGALFMYHHPKPMSVEHPNKVLQWYYDENRIFPIEAILKQTSTLYEKKNAVYFFQISLFIPKIFKFLKYAN